MTGKIDRGFSPSVNNRIARAFNEKDTLPFRGAMFAKVIAPSDEAERVKVSSVLGKKNTSFVYPFASQNAWIRGQPELGTTMLTIIGGDTGDLQAVSYFDPQKAGAATAYKFMAGQVRSQPADTTLQRSTAYRTLGPGEVDMASQYAQTFMGMRDVHQSRGGLSHMVMRSIGAKVQTPQFSVEGPAHSTGFSLRDEIRYGTVRRAVPGTSTPTIPSLVRGAGVNTRDPTAGAPFAKEFSVLLDWFGTPNKLIDHRQGIVVEDNGQIARDTQTQRPLRARLQWHSTGDFTSVEVDEAGNFNVVASAEATDGGVVSIPQGNFAMKVGTTPFSGGRAVFQVASDFEQSAGGRWIAQADQGFRLTTPARGEIVADFGLNLKSTGRVNVSTGVPMGIALGTDPTTIKHPVLVGNPTYLETLRAWLNAESVVDGNLNAYATAAATAWAEVGALLMLLDPTGATSTPALNAGAAAGALAASAIAANTALAAHQPTLSPMPGGFLAMRVIAE